MSNPHRGDVRLLLPDGPVTLRLTLGALAEIESAFGVDGLQALGERLQRGSLGARDLVALLGSAARGAGERVRNEELAARIGAADIPACVTALAELLAVTFGDGK